MFQSALLESAANRNRRTLRLPLAAAAALHGAAILAIVGASLWSPGDAPSPPAQIVFVETRIPPAPGGEDRAHRAAPYRAVKQRTFVQPVPIPQELAAPQDRRDHSRERVEADDWIGGGAQPDGVSGTGSGPGMEDGLPGGTGEDPAGRDAVIPATSATEMPVLIVRHEPAYPDAARRICSEGLVVLEAVISGTGVVENVQVVKSVNALLDMAAVHAVEQWRYRPATLNGRAVRVALSVTVRFSLH